MTANAELIPVNEGATLRGFANLFRKENRSWWGTRRWWINALIWPVILCGLLANMLFVPTIANMATEAEIARAGGIDAHVLNMGVSAFFEFGLTVVAIGAVILSQDLIIGEKQAGIAEWLLSKPIARRAYILSKLAANMLAMIVLLIGLPSLIAYGMFSIRNGALFPAGPFLSGVGIMVVHTFFYLTLTLLLGAIFNTRGAILGIALGSILGGALVGSFIKPLLKITPWSLAKVANLTASGQPLPLEMGALPIIATLVWSLLFIAGAMIAINRIEF